jgi:uncharacterized cofD-like protein
MATDQFTHGAGNDATPHRMRRTRSRHVGGSPKRKKLSMAEPLTKASRPRIVALGGGTGLPVVLAGLLARLMTDGEPTAEQLTALVSVTDDRGSAGRLRRELRMLPPDDIRNCLVALADPASPWLEVLQHRFSHGEWLRGHAVGNLMLAGLNEVTGDFTQAVDLVGRLLSLRGRVLPSTEDEVSLQAEFPGPRYIRGATAITSQRRPIARLSLDPPVRPVPEALRAIINADAIVIGPGSLYTSILPILLVDGIAATIHGVSAARIFVSNLLTEPGETDGFTLSDHLRVIRRHTGFDLFDYVIVNRRPLDLAPECADAGQPVPVRTDAIDAVTRARVAQCDLAMERDRGKLLHAPRDLGSAILQLIGDHTGDDSTASFALR